MLFIDKYKPKNFEDIIGNSQIIKQLSNMNKKKILPNLIITGTTGLGKTSSIYCLCNKYIKNTKENVLEINTSIDKNFSLIRSILMDFIKKKTHEQKIVVFEEIDNLPETSQHTIYSLLNSSNVIYILTCNSINKVMKNLKHKCLVLNFKTLTDDEIRMGLLNIITHEKIEYDENGLDLLVKYSQNDLRYAINNLQALYIGYGKITYEVIHCLMESSLEYILYNLMGACESKDFEKSLNIIDDLIKDKYMYSDIMFILTEQIKRYEFKTDDNQLKFIDIISIYYLNVLKGVKTPIQLYSLIYELCNIN